MPLSTEARRAIAIRGKVARKASPAPVAANDNQPSARIRGGARVMTTAMLEACLAASGHVQHQEY